MADPTPQRGKFAGRRVEHAPRIGDGRAEGPGPRPAARRLQEFVERSGCERDVGVGHDQPRRAGAGRPPVGRAAIPKVAPGTQ